MGKPEGRPSWRPRFIWEDNIKMDLREVRCDSGDWIDLAQDMSNGRHMLGQYEPLGS